MNLLAITIADPETGSTKFRIAQYRETLAAHGIVLNMVSRHASLPELRAALAAADVVLNQKCLLGWRAARHVWRRTSRVAFDFDDAIYTSPGPPRSLLTRLRVSWRLRSWLRRSKVAVAANEYLAGYARRFARRVEVVPMGIDLDAWSPALRPDAGRVVVGWAGAPVNLPCIESLAPVLAQVLSGHDNVVLRVYSGERPRLAVPFEHVPYAPGTEADFIRSLDIGLLPLVDEEHSRGKSPIKSIQYLACGVPVVGNVLGATAEICTPGNSVAVGHDPAEWVGAISRLATDPGLRQALGAQGRRHAEEHFDARRNGALLAGLLEELAG